MKKFLCCFYSGPDKHNACGKRWTDWQPGPGQSCHTFNDYINFSDKTAWQEWWGKNWIRTDIGEYDNPGFDDLTMSLAFLPDLKTESMRPLGCQYFTATSRTPTPKRLRDTRCSIT